MVRLTVHLDMTIAVDWDLKPQIKICPGYKKERSSSKEQKQYVKADG